MATIRSTRRDLLGLLMGSALSNAALANVAGKFAQRYSYYSPGTGTVNVGGEFEPALIRPHGERISTDLLVLTGMSQRLVRLAPTGKLRWALELRPYGGSYGLGLYHGLAVVCFGLDVLFVDIESGRVAARLPVLDASPTPLGFLRVQGDLLIAGDSSEKCSIVIAKLTHRAGKSPSLSIVDRLSTRTYAPRDAMLLDADTLLVADTFGHSVVRFERRSRWRETRRIAEYYPNMLGSHDGLLEVLSEHGNRLSLWELGSNRRDLTIGCPHPLFADPYTKPQQIATEEAQTRSGEGVPRQICSAELVGSQTLYAANGFFREQNGRVWVADADNHRVALFIDGRFHGALTGINHPVRVVPVGSAPGRDSM